MAASDCPHRNIADVISVQNIASHAHLTAATTHSAAAAENYGDMTVYSQRMHSTAVASNSLPPVPRYNFVTQNRYVSKVSM